MTPQQIMDALLNAQTELTELNKKLFSFGKEREYAEQQYRIQLNKKLLQLRIEKCTSTIIQDVAKGDKYISDLRLNKGLAENKYNVCLEAIRDKRLQIETLRSLLTWQRVEYGNS